MKTKTNYYLFFCIFLYLNFKVRFVGSVRFWKVQNRNRPIFNVVHSVRTELNRIDQVNRTEHLISTRFGSIRFGSMNRAHP